MRPNNRYLDTELFDRSPPWLRVGGQQLALTANPISVYIVDDDEGVRPALARMFRSAGFDCQQFSSTKELLAADVACHRACVVTDLNLAGDDPTELPVRLKARYMDLPVVFVSADDSDASRSKVRAVGGLGLYRKPVDSQALIDAVRWAIDARTECS